MPRAAGDVLRFDRQTYYTNIDANVFRIKKPFDNRGKNKTILTSRSLLRPLAQHVSASKKTRNSIGICRDSDYRTCSGDGWETERPVQDSGN